MADDYNITVSDGITHFNLNDGEDDTKLRDIKQWGTATWSSMENAFRGALIMQMSATVEPNLSEVESMVQMFDAAYAFTGGTGSINKWDVSNVTKINSMFEDAARVSG